MTLFIDIQTHILQSQDDYTTYPDLMSIGRNPDGELVIKAKWKKQEHSDEDSDDDFMDFPRYNTFRTEPTESIKNRTTEIIDDFVTKLKNCDVQTFSRPKLVKTHIDTNEWDESKYKLHFFTGIKGTIKPLPTNIKSEICSCYKNLDSSLQPSQLEKVEIIFSDYTHLQTNNLRISLLTDQPHLYYDIIDSIDEYKEVADNYSLDENGPPYRVENLRLWSRDGEIPNSIDTFAKNNIHEKPDSDISLSEPYYFEAENLCFSEKKNEYEGWIRIPIIEDNYTMD